MSDKTENAYDVLVTEDIEVRHEASGVLIKTKKEVLVSGLVTAVSAEAAIIKAIRKIPPESKADSDMMKVSIRPFCRN